ncbi:swr complex subunit [Mortierella alpina]|nr:swr complex subunit [Mortierella alpina]
MCANIRRCRSSYLDGISRELYGLIGNNVSTVAFNNPTYKPKLAKGKKAVNWTWRPFMNPSRDDDLTLHHWEKTRTDPNEEYRFYKFNKAISLIDFTESDYTNHLQDSDWSYDETKYLWDLCRRFDLRWVVIQDRYEWPAQEQDRMALQYYNGNSLAPKSIAPSDTTNTTSTTAAASTTAATTQSVTEPKLSEISAEPLPTPVTLTQPDAVATAESAPAPSTVPEATTNADTATASTTTTQPAPAEVVSHDNKATPASEPSGATTASAMDIVTFTPPKVRSMEDLKSRYYYINRVLTKARMTDPSQSSEKAQLLASMAYDKNREIERKKNLEILNTRTPEQIEEEEALYLEARRIDQNEKKITRERENLLRLLNTRDIYGPGGPASAGLAGQVAGGPGTGIIIPSNSITIPSSSSSSGASGANANGPMSPIGKNANGTSSSAAAAAGGAGGASVKKRKKAPKGSVQADDTLSGSGSGAGAGSASASSSTKGSANNRRPSNSSTSDILAATLPPPKKEKLIPGAYLRSQKTAPVVSTKQQRVQSTLVQLGLPFKPAMPTATVIAKWDQLSNNIVTLLDLKKQVDKLESDLKVVKMRRGSGSSGSSLIPGSVGVGATGAGAGASSAGSIADGNFGVKREGTADEAGASGQVKKKKKKE